MLISKQHPFNCKIMRINQKLIVILFTLFFGQNSLAAFSNFNTITIDTIPEVVQVYKGNRIMVKGIKINKQKGKSIKITYNLKNTGRNKIKLGKKRIPPSDLIIEFDNSLAKNDLTSAKASIIENLKKQDISIRPGQLIMGGKLKFKNIEIPPSDRIAEVEDKPTVEEPTAQTELPQSTVEEIINSEIPIEEIEETPSEINPSEAVVVEEIVESTSDEMIEVEVPTPEKVDKTILVETPPSKSLNEPISAVKEIEMEKEAIEEVVTIEVPAEKEIETEVLETPVVEMKETVVIQDQIEEEVETTIIESPVDEIVETTKVETPVEEIVTEEIENTSANTINEKQCPDLAVVKVEVAKKNKRNVTIKYTITNTGNIPIALLGDTKKEEDNISIQVYFTRSEKLTRGAIPVKSFYIKKGLKGNGFLEPNGTYSGKIKVETSKVTKFTPVLALSIDPNQDTNECTRINNVSFVNITENAAPKSDNPLPIQPLEANEDEIIGANEIKER